MARSNKKNTRATNRDARIVSVFNGARVTTRTIYRDSFTLKAKVLTENNNTSLRIRLPFGNELFLTGAEARTIFRTLRKHYRATGRSTR